MSTLGIEISDVGVNGVLIDKEGVSRTLKMGVNNDRTPAVVCASDGELVFGAEAMELSVVYPRRANSEFLDDLSFQATTLDGHRGRLAYSQMAYKFFENIVRRANRQAPDLERVALAVPGHFLESNEKSEERLGLLLGIFQDLELPLSGLVDMAASSMYSEGLWNVPEGDSIFHVDLLLHATHITVFRRNEGLERVHFSRLPQYGFVKMLEHFSGALANRFLKQTAFDITADREIEKAFHAQTCDMLYNIGRVGEASLEVSTREKSRQMTITREIAALDLAPQVKLLTQMLLRAVNDFADGNGGIQIVLSERAASIQGLKEALSAQGIGQVTELPVESAAFGAAGYSKDWPVAENVEDIRVEVGISLEGLPQPTAEQLARHAVGHVNLVKEGKSLAPTHIVCDGLAYELNGDSFVIGVGESESFDLVADRQYAGKSAEICRLVLSDDRWILTEGKGSTVDSKSVSGLKAGDAIEIRSIGQRKRLLLIHCML